MQDVNDMINEKEGILSRLRNENRELIFFKEEFEQLKTEYERK